MHVATVLEEAGRFDLIHNHVGDLLMAFSGVVDTPMLTTIHGPLGSDADVVWNHYRGYYNSISWASRAGLPNRGYLGVVYNGIDVDSYPFRADKEDFLLFLGRLSEEKGTHLAIDVARAVGRRLIIAGKVDRADVAYYERLIAPRVDRTQIVYVGEADAQLKRELYARAHCLLHPVTWSEPFGLVMVEAMACGTPVIAIGRGSVPEIVVDGQTGFVVDDVEQMIAAIPLVGMVDPGRCRAHVAANFSATRMGAAYERLFEQVVAGAC
jgi:glycosyltransferase involved in cell wall biosynthesis